MSRISKDVGGYRGRRTITDILKLIAIALAVIVVLVLAGLFYLQKYLVYTDEGVRLELPPILQMFRREGKEPDASASLPDPGDISVVIDSGSGTGQPPAEPEKPSLAIQLPVEDVLNGTAAAKLEEAGADTLILEMKAPDGKLAWYSEDYTAQWAEVSAPQSNNDALKQWNEEVYTIARVCCFRDDSAPYSRNKLALRKGNYNWRDELGLRWLSPAHEESQEYIANLCGELAALGFDEIVLEQWHFPVGGKTENISRGDRYNPDAFTTELESFLNQVVEAVNGSSTGLTTVSLRFTGDMLGEGSALSGVTPQLMLQYGNQLWCDQKSRSVLLEVYPSSVGSGRLVEIVPQADEDRTQFQAVIPEE